MGRTVSVGGRPSWAQKALVIAQAAMSLVLLSAAAMLGGSLRNLEHQNFGFERMGAISSRSMPLLGNYKQEQLVPLFRADSRPAQRHSRSAQRQLRNLCADVRQPVGPRHSAFRANQSPARRTKYPPTGLA